MSIGTLSRHTLRQLKFIIPGGLVTFWLDTHNKFWSVFVGNADATSWARFSATIAVALGVVTFALFMYILLFPIIQGEKPDFRHWRQSGILSRVIPTLTVSIVLGWCLTSYILSHWSGLGIMQGTIGASGLYALSIGLIGLIPAPKSYRRS